MDNLRILNNNNNNNKNNNKNNNNNKTPTTTANKQITKQNWGPWTNRKSISLNPSYTNSLNDYGYTYKTKIDIANELAIEYLRTDTHLVRRKSIGPLAASTSGLIEASFSLSQ